MVVWTHLQWGATKSNILHVQSMSLTFVCWIYFFIKHFIGINMFETLFKNEQGSNNKENIDLIC